VPHHLQVTCLSAAPTSLPRRGVRAPGRTIALRSARTALANATALRAAHRCAISRGLPGDSMTGHAISAAYAHKLLPHLRLLACLRRRFFCATLFSPLLRTRASSLPSPLHHLHETSHLPASPPLSPSARTLRIPRLAPRCRAVVDERAVSTFQLTPSPVVPEGAHTSVISSCLRLLRLPVCVDYGGRQQALLLQAVLLSSGDALATTVRFTAAFHHHARLSSRTPPRYASTLCIGSYATGFLLAPSPRSPFLPYTAMRPIRDMTRRAW